MVDDSVRRLMGRIAKGLPIVVLGAAPFVLSGCLGCCPPDRYEAIVVSQPTASDGGVGAESDCYTLCEAVRPSWSYESPTCAEVPEGIECQFYYHCVSGRRPEQPYVATARATVLEPRGRWLTEMASLELASVPAFHELADALTRLGAPAALVGGARQSADDEVQHARLAFALARREGGPSELRVETRRTRGSSLRDLAIHNAKEGCVGEAYGALEAAWQAQHASDERTRGVFATIARDEAQHAQLSLDIDRWARVFLDEDGRRAVDAARANTARELGEALSARTPPDGLGLPPSPAARALLAMVA